MVLVAFVLASAAAVLAGCGSSGQPATRDDSAAAFVFEDRCASCHRPGGPGKDTATMDLADAREVILGGRVDKGMPAFAGVLMGRQVDEMVEWLATQQGVPMPTVATSAAG
jgi:mono/diheme cytochrome c family protein